MGAQTIQTTFIRLLETFLDLIFNYSSTKVSKHIFAKSSQTKLSQPNHLNQII